MDEQNSWQGTLLEDKARAGGLLYRRNRYYDPNTGRFTQEDPIGLAGGMNLYGFAGGDPVNFADPFGLCTFGKDCWKAFVRHAKAFWNDPATKNSFMLGAMLFADATTDPDSGGASIDAEMQVIVLGSRTRRLEQAAAAEQAVLRTRWGWQGQARYKAAVRQLKQLQPR